MITHLPLLKIILFTTFSLFNFEQLSPYKYQALYIYNFAKYITWPNDSHSIVIGVYDDSQILAEFNRSLKGQRVNKKRIEIRSVYSIEESFNCQIVYLPQRRSNELENLVVALEGKSILIVTEDDLAEKGAPISFLEIDNKQRFKLNMKALEKCRLKASRGLINLAILI